jgi:hypothetical protein
VPSTPGNSDSTKVATAAATTAAPTSASSVYNKSGENAKVAASNQNSKAPVIVSAPSVTNVSNNKQNIAMPAPVRNEDSGFSRYVRSNVVLA